MTFKEDRARTREPGQKIGGVRLWCETCQDFKRIDESTYDGRCPECSQPLFRMKCTRCDAQWYPRDPMMLPGTCPKCKSPYWNRERTKAPSKKKETPKVDPELAALLERKINESREAKAAEPDTVVRI